MNHFRSLLFIYSLRIISFFSILVNLSLKSDIHIVKLFSSFNVKFNIYSYLQTYLVGNANYRLFDVAYNDDYSRIVASRFFIQTKGVKDPSADTDMMNKLREVAKKSPLNVTVFNPRFILFDQVNILVRICHLNKLVQYILKFSFDYIKINSLWEWIFHNSIH